jgi:hypothetical protein
MPVTIKTRQNSATTINTTPEDSTNQTKQQLNPIASQCVVHSSPLYTTLDYTRDNLVRHSGTVLHPVLAVLLSTPVIIPKSSVDQQNGEVQRVEKGQRVGKKSRTGPAHRNHDLRDVVEVSNVYNSRKSHENNNNSKQINKQIIT